MSYLDLKWGRLPTSTSTTDGIVCPYRPKNSATADSGIRAIGRPPFTDTRTNRSHRSARHFLTSDRDTPRCSARVLSEKCFSTAATNGPFITVLVVGTMTKVAAGLGSFASFFRLISWGRLAPQPVPFISRFGDDAVARGSPRVNWN